MNLKLLSIPIALTGSVGGTYLGYKYISSEEPKKSKKSIKSKLEGLLLGFENSFNDKWEDRATLANSKTNLPKSLSKFKNEERGNKISTTNIKEWCQTQIDREFVSETDFLFLSVRSYCTFNNKDKLKGKAISENLEGNNTLKAGGLWSKVNDKLKRIDNSKLSSKMGEIKAKISASEPTQKDELALKKWCETSYTSYFKGEEDKGFKDTESYCTEV